jgi:hypothetical protein
MEIDKKLVSRAVEALLRHEAKKSKGSNKLFEDANKPILLQVLLLLRSMKLNLFCWFEPLLSLRFN